MLINGINSGTFIRTLLALSNSFMEKVNTWQRDFLPPTFEGFTKEAQQAIQSPFDFIIVGSGYAGSLLTRRLISTGCYRILLLEAGPTPKFDTSIPFLQPANTSEYSWNYATVPQRYAAKGLKERKVKLLAGKGLGGSSLLSSGIYLPENPDDFSRWSNQFGLVEWDVPQIEPFFFTVRSKLITKKGGEKFDNDTTSLKNDSIINNGPSSAIPVKDELKLRNENPLTFLWIQGGMSMGYPIDNGITSKLYNDGGFFVPNIMSKNGIRMTAANQFLSQKINQLVVITKAEVLKLRYDPTRRIVIGVDVKDVSTSKIFTASITREVLLAAGAIGTAQLLIQSGIGPADHLDELKIPVVQQLPVGVELRDRVSADLFVTVRDLFMEPIRKRLGDMDQLKMYIENGTGLYASSSTFGAAILKSKNNSDPNVLLEMKPSGIMGEEEMLNDIGYDQKTFNLISSNSNIFRNGGMQIRMTVLNPYSIGTMWLRSRQNGSSLTPVINPSYLQDERDTMALVQATEFVEKLMETSYMSLLEAQLVKPNFADCPSPSNVTAKKAYWKCALRYLTTTGQQLTGTAPFLTVTEPNLKVRGLRGVRVVDESLFPESVTGGVPATIMAIASKAAQMIINDNKQGCSPVGQTQL